MSDFFKQLEAPSIPEVHPGIVDLSKHRRPVRFLRRRLRTNVDQYASMIEAMSELSEYLEMYHTVSYRGFFITHSNDEAIAYLIELLREFDSAYHNRMKIQTLLRINKDGLPVNVGSVFFEICRCIRNFFIILIERIKLYQKRTDHGKCKDTTSMRVVCSEETRCMKSVLFCPCFHSVCCCRFSKRKIVSNETGLYEFFCPVCGEYISNCLSSEDYERVNDSGTLFAKMTDVMRMVSELETKISTRILSRFIPSNFQDLSDTGHLKYPPIQPEKGIKIEIVTFHSL